MGKFIDLTGQRFGRLVVSKRVEGIRPVTWLCVCDCGNTTNVKSTELKCGDTKSCGCLRSEKSSARMKKYNKPKYGNTVTRNIPLYSVWCSMRQRCNNPNDHNYIHYGGRGISVCAEWEDYNNFEKWAIYHGYEAGLSIDRIDNDGSYSPENCRWVGRDIQACNKRTSHKITFQGRTQTLHEWAEEIRISEKTLSERIRSGWNIERALTEPVNVKFRKK